jgi:hypothetical protein
MRNVLTTLLFFIMLPAVAQQSVTQLRETAIAFQRQGDYSNTLMVLSKALEKEPSNLTLLKDMAYTYYLSGKVGRASEIIAPLIDLPNADVEVFQIAGTIYIDAQEFKQAEKVYKRGLKQFSASGPLYSEYGELLWGLKRPAEAIISWETGIITDPSYSGNYYHAAKFYFAALDMARSIVYGEIFVNLESYSVRTPEVKILLLESYKKAFMADASKQYFVKPTTPFEVKFNEVLQKQALLALRGITPETLLIIRSRFVLDWFSVVEGNYPLQLFTNMQYLLREGLFEAYNQWLFGTVTDVATYQYWTRTHQEEYSRFSQYQQNKIFRMPTGQHYF